MKERQSLSSCPCCNGTGKQPIPGLVDASVAFCGLCRGKGVISQAQDHAEVNPLDMIGDFLIPIGWYCYCLRIDRVVCGDDFNRRRKDDPDYPYCSKMPEGSYYFECTRFDLTKDRKPQLTNPNPNALQTLRFENGILTECREHIHEEDEPMTFDVYQPTKQLELTLQ